MKRTLLVFGVIVVCSYVTDFHSATYLSVDVFYYVSYFTMALAADYEWQRRQRAPAVAL